MPAPTRIYLVKPRGDTTSPGRLVRATHPAHALRHVADGAYSVEVAGQEDLLALVQAGQQVESIKAEQVALPET